MIHYRKSEERGSTHIDWLESKHSFSFGDYYDDQHMGFGSLRVINEDWVKPAAGFGTHPHRDMEIITYILDGALEHKDSLGTGSVIVPGEVQRMTAGTGITHSEFNAHKDQNVHLLQIWIVPNQRGLPPSYEQKSMSERRQAGQLTLVASQDGRQGSVTVHQDVNLYVLDLIKDQTYSYPIQTDRKVWLQVARGSAVLNQVLLEQGDGAAISHETSIEIKSSEGTEILLFDLAA